MNNDEFYKNGNSKNDKLMNARCDVPLTKFYVNISHDIRIKAADFTIAYKKTGFKSRKMYCNIFK